MISNVVDHNMYATIYESLYNKINKEIKNLNDKINNIIYI